MADRVSVGRLIVGHGAQRRVIPAGERFETRNVGIDDAEAAAMEGRGTLRRPRDDIRRQAAVPGPRAEGDGDRIAGEGATAETLTEQQAADAAKAAEAEAGAADAGNGGTGRGRRGRTSDLDL